jgi:hypothetical protein
MPAKVVKYAHNLDFLETKSKASGHPKSTGIWIVEVIPSKIEIQAEYFEDVPHTQRILPIRSVRGRLQGNIGWSTQGDIALREFTPGRPEADDLP